MLFIKCAMGNSSVTQCMIPYCRLASTTGSRLIARVCSEGHEFTAGWRIKFIGMQPALPNIGMQMGAASLPVGPFSCISEHNGRSIKLRKRGKRIKRYAESAHQPAALRCVHRETLVAHRSPPALHQSHLLARSEAGSSAVRLTRSARTGANLSSQPTI